MDTIYYDHYWSESGFRPEHSLWPELRAKYEEFLPPGGRIVDLGCGDGSTSGIWMTANGYDYLGLDVSSTAIATASGRGLPVELITDGSSTGLESGSVDAVVCIEVLEHLFLPQRTVAEIRRILKPGGILIATTPNIGYWRSRINLLLLGRFDPIGDHMSVAEPWRDPHIRFFTPETLGRLFASEALELVQVGGHEGGFLNGLPWVPRFRRTKKQSRAYRWFERRWPGLFAYRTCVIARRTFD